MRFQKYLNEEYVFAYKDIVFFKNPTSKEMKEACYDNNVRFMLDIKHKNVYMWRYDFLHFDASEELHKYGVKNNYDYPFAGEDFLWGTGTFIAGKIKALQYEIKTFTKNHSNTEKALKDLEFTKKYFNNTILDTVRAYSRTSE